MEKKLPYLEYLSLLTSFPFVNLSWILNYWHCLELDFSALVAFSCETFLWAFLATRIAIFNQNHV